jgi:citrate lyase subunit beta / citryl-CoA lyase
MFRSLLFVPGNSQKFIEKSKTLDADIICLDLEDSVPPNQKPLAREMIRGALSERNSYHSSSALYVRINSVDSGFAVEDLSASVQQGIEGIIVPKVNTEDTIIDTARLVSKLEEERAIVKGHINLIASIETAQGVLNAYDIAKADGRINALLFGVFDFLYDMHLDYVENNGTGYAYARAKLPVDARAAGALAIDAIWQNVDDTEGLKRDTQYARRLGYSGKSIIHPSQIDPVHKIFVPTKTEIEWAKKVVRSLAPAVENGTATRAGAISLEGRMIDIVHYKLAKSILDLLNPNEQNASQK